MNRPSPIALLAAAAGAGLFFALQPSQKAKQTFRFTGKRVLITGGSRGFGFALAKRLAAEGARIALCARSHEELDRAAARLRTSGHEATVEVCDVTDRGQITALIDGLVQRWGALDVLVNNAGEISVGPSEAMEERDYRDAMDVNFWGPLYAMEAAAKHMRKQREGRILNIASVGGKIAVPHMLPYSASKFELVGLSRGMRSELARYGVVVTTACPGLMRTGSYDQVPYKGDHAKEKDWFAVADSLPVVSMDADAAAADVLAACARGDAEVVTGIPAQIAVTLDALFPEMTSQLASTVAGLLPNQTEDNGKTKVGRDIKTAITSSVLTALSRKAMADYNESPV